MGRFIPARAGNTVRFCCPLTLFSVHPRPRGEHSGPHVFPFGVQRFIPARAGNTSPQWPSAALLPVHPRPRGEHLHRARRHRRHGGSSPPARGTLRTAPQRCRPWAVHPRPRGEHEGQIVFCDPIVGSSPPARGTRHRRDDLKPRHRFIPARAGNTRRPTPTSSTSSVHPRPRGEHTRHLRSSYPHTGSSPPARGTPGRPAARSDSDRFIPARAGNTRSSRSAGTSRPVHPRPRGEHVGAYAGQMGSSGSSPPRGEHSTACVCCAAYAGSSPPARGTRGPACSSMFAAPVHPRPRGEHLWKTRGVV